jgi:hypothetical protein
MLCSILLHSSSAVYQPCINYFLHYEKKINYYHVYQPCACGISSVTIEPAFDLLVTEWLVDDDCVGPTGPVAFENDEAFAEGVVVGASNDVEFESNVTAFAANL